MKKIESILDTPPVSWARGIVRSESARFASAVFVPLLLLTIVRIVGFNAENSVDAYYHVALADFGPSYYMSKKCPHLTLSVWSERFSDKELGYHLLLTFVRRLKRTANLAGSPPFNSEALFFDFLAILAFVIACRTMGVRDTIFYAVALVIISPFFTNRLLMLRPHNLSIAIMITACAIFHVTSLKRTGPLLAFILGFVAAWAYSNPHFLLLPALAFGVLGYLRVGSRSAILLPLAVVVGIAVGYTLHPQFPNTFINWKIQCVDVVWQAIAGTKTVALGTEFNRPGPVWFLKNILPFIAFACDAWLFAKLAKRRVGETRLSAFRRVDTTVSAMFAVASIAILATPLGIRAMEYTCPFVLLSIGANIAAFRSSEQSLPSPFDGKGFAFKIKSLLAVMALAFIVFQTENYSRKKGMPPISDFAGYMKSSGIPQNTVIANLSWSDYPFLLYSCPEYRYISGLDPMFSYSLAPRKMKKMELFRRGKLKLSTKELNGLLGSKYLFLRRMYKKYAEKIGNTGCETLYDGPDGWLFIVPDE